jgi:hypothetical protein
MNIIDQDTNRESSRFAVRPSTEVYCAGANCRACASRCAKIR